MQFRKTAAALLPLILVAAAQPAPAPAPPQQPAAALRWVADWGERRCTLARTAANATPVIALRLLPGGSHVELIFPNRPPPPGAAAGARAALVFSDGSRSDVRLGWRRPGEAAQLSVLAQPALLDRLARSAAVKLVHRGDTLADVPLPRAGAAIAALRRCADSALAEWGVDPAAQAALQRRPQHVLNGVSWITSADYPRAALQRSSSGEVIVRLGINSYGRVTQCAVAVSSGDADLDATSCRLFVSRGRYEPALDHLGQPTDASTIEAVIWTLPQ
jgi:TonB family protein